MPCVYGIRWAGDDLFRDAAVGVDFYWYLDFHFLNGGMIVETAPSPFTTPHQVLVEKGTKWVVPDGLLWPRVENAFGPDPSLFEGVSAPYSVRSHDCCAIFSCIRRAG